jgi:DNA-binding PadR family transcriptional regulator
MWLNIIKAGSKKLSPQELLVLSTVEREFQPANKILDSIKNKTTFWQPEAGVIYPILHRLNANNLLEKLNDDQMQFRLSNLGVELLSSSFPLIVTQFHETLDFYERISETLVEIDPLLAQEYLDKLKNRFAKSLETVEKLQSKATKLIERDNWKDIDVEF